jgi:hypothetical protein
VRASVRPFLLREPRTSGVSVTLRVWALAVFLRLRVFNLSLGRFNTVVNLAKPFDPLPLPVIIGALALTHSAPRVVVIRVALPFAIPFSLFPSVGRVVSSAVAGLCDDRRGK